MVLFLGTVFTPDLKRAVLALPPSVQILWIQAAPSDYLEKIDSEGIEYLGKSLAKSVLFSSLNASAAHILSVLERILILPEEKQLRAEDLFPLVLMGLPSY